MGRAAESSCPCASALLHARLGIQLASALLRAPRTAAPAHCCVSSCALLESTKMDRLIRLQVGVQGGAAAGGGQLQRGARRQAPPRWRGICHQALHKRHHRRRVQEAVGAGADTPSLQPGLRLTPPHRMQGRWMCMQQTRPGRMAFQAQCMLHGSAAAPLLCSCGLTTWHTATGDPRLGAAGQPPERGAVLQLLVRARQPRRRARLHPAGEVRSSISCAALSPSTPRRPCRQDRDGM